MMVAMLSLLLPLQTSLAYARAVSMMTGKAGLMATRVQPAATLPESSSSAGHHHTADAHAGNAASAFEAEPEAAPEHSSHKKSGNACDSCAKCCLTSTAGHLVADGEHGVHPGAVFSCRRYLVLLHSGRP
jgi:hypothetical protein